MPNSLSSPSSGGGDSARRLLVVDDDRELCALLAEYMKREGFAVVVEHDGVQGLLTALESPWHALVLDVMLPGLGGFEVLRRVREKSRVPVIMLTARGDHVDRIVGLEMGADDYVPKPFDPRELAARIRAVLRRYAPAETAGENRIEVGAMAVDPGVREAWVSGRRLELTAVEFDLLLALAREAGRVVSRDALSRAALGRAFHALDRSVDMHVSNLRRKLGAGPSGPLIKTVRNVGYLLPRPSEPARS